MTDAMDEGGGSGGSGGGGGGGTTFSWLDFANAPLPPNPFTAIPEAVADLESGDDDRKQRALRDLKQFDAEDVASSDRWLELLAHLQGMLFSHDAADAPLVRDVMEVHWLWFQRAAPQQAGELADGVLRAVTEMCASLEFVASSTGEGLLLEYAASSAPPEVWQLFRLAHAFLHGIAKHFRYLPEALLDSIVVATVRLLAATSPAPSPAEGAPQADDALVVLDPAHFMAFLDPEGEWFRLWCCRLHASQFGHYIIASGLLATLVQRSQNKGRCSRRSSKSSASTAAAASSSSSSSSSSPSSDSSTRRAKRCMRLDVPKIPMTDPTGEERKLAPVPFVENVMLLHTVSTLGSIAIFHHGIIARGGRITTPDDDAATSSADGSIVESMPSATANGLFRLLPFQSQSASAIETTTLVQELSHNLLRRYLGTSTYSTMFTERGQIKIERVCATALAELAIACPTVINAIVSELLGPPLIAQSSDKDDKAATSRLASILPCLGGLLYAAFGENGPRPAMQTSDSTRGTFHAFLTLLLALHRRELVSTKSLIPVVGACMGFIQVGYLPITDDVHLLPALKDLAFPDGPREMRHVLSNWGCTAAGVGALDRCGLTSLCASHLSNEVTDLVSTGIPPCAALLLRNICASREGYAACIESPLFEALRSWFIALPDSLDEAEQVLSEDRDLRTATFSTLDFLLDLSSSEFCFEVEPMRIFINEAVETVTLMAGSSTVNELLAIQVLTANAKRHSEALTKIPKLLEAAALSTEFTDAASAPRKKLLQALTASP